MAIHLSDTQKLTKREVYTILALVGDIGGLYDGLRVIIGFFLITYNVAMFDSALISTLFKF